MAKSHAIARDMTQNPPNLRPDLARARIEETIREGQPKIGMVSLGCPKALVDSERILTRLRAEGYGISANYSGADAVIVNTCGFLDSAKAESLDAIAEALRARVWPLIESGRVRPVIDSTVALADAAKAHERMESGEHIGKIVLTV